MPGARKLPSGRYQARYYLTDGTRRTAAVPGGITYTHKDKALKAASDYERELATGPRHYDAKRTWGQWCQEWWPTRLVEASTLSRDASRRDHHLMKKWQNVPLVDITRHDVRAWAAQLSRSDLSTSTVQRIVHLFSASLNAAIDAELLTSNPAAKLKLAPAVQGSEHFITPEEFALIGNELDDAEFLMATLLFNTGLRFGEAAGLHWGRVDLERRVLTTVEVFDDRERVMKPYPKGRRIRDVPIPDEVLALLPETAPRGGDCGIPHTSGSCRGGLVLRPGGGGVWDGSNFRKEFYKAVEFAGVEHTRVHDLRHSYASRLLQQGLQLERIGQLLGHVSTATTQRYSHLVKDRHDDVFAILNSRPASAGVSSPVRAVDPRRASNVPARGAGGS